MKADMGVLGLQLGIGIAMIFQCASYVAILVNSDWQEISDRAKLRIKTEAIEMEK